MHPITVDHLNSSQAIRVSLFSDFLTSKAKNW